MIRGAQECSDNRGCIVLGMLAQKSYNEDSESEKMQVVCSELKIKISERKLFSLKTNLGLPFK